MAKTTLSILEHINNALRDKIIYWNDPEKGAQFGVVDCVNEKGYVIVNQSRLPESMKSNLDPTLKPWQYIKIIGMEVAMMGVYEPVSLN